MSLNVDMNRRVQSSGRRAGMEQSAVQGGGGGLQQASGLMEVLEGLNLLGIQMKVALQ